MANEHRTALRWSARSGYFARGIIYLIVAVFAFLAAFGKGTEARSTHGALRSVADEPFGFIILALLGLGLVGYSIWRFVEAVFDADRRGSDLRGIAERTAIFVSGLAYLSLAFLAANIVVGTAKEGGDDAQAQAYTELLMSQPFGPYLVGAAGIILVIVALEQFNRALKEKFKRYIHAPGHMGWVSPISKFGLMSRGVVFAIIGVFLVIAAWNVNPSDAKGLQGALQWLHDQSYGAWLLGLIAIGLGAFAIYSLVESRYRIIPDPK